MFLIENNNIANTKCTIQTVRNLYKRYRVRCMHVTSWRNSGSGDNTKKGNSIVVGIYN